MTNPIFHQIGNVENWDIPRRSVGANGEKWDNISHITLAPLILEIKRIVNRCRGVKQFENSTQ